MKKSLMVIALVTLVYGHGNVHAENDTNKKNATPQTTALESCLRQIRTQDITVQNLGTLFNLRTNAPNAEIQATVARACGAGLLYLGKNDSYQKGVRDKIPKVADFERLLLAKCEPCDGNGKTTGNCRKCIQSGKCAEGNCQGGTVPGVGFDGRSVSYICRACKGTGVCAECKGQGQTTSTCLKCKGQGGTFTVTTALSQHKKEIEAAIDAFEAIRQAAIDKAVETEFATKMRDTKIDATREAIVAEGKAKGEERARQEAVIAREEAERQRKAAEDEKYAEIDKGYLESIVIIQGNRGSGSGFLCEFKGRKTLLSNVHVLVGNTLRGSNALKLRTIHAGDVSYKHIRVHKDRDIVAYELDKTDNLCFLNIYQGTYNNQEEVVVFGNSKGGGVATTLRGKMKGIGPDDIEVDAEFVPGNSGSPIIAYPYNAVVGIATYAVNNPQIDWTTRGTRFEKVRRFGVRLDNAEWSDFIEVDVAEYTQALQVFEAIEEFATTEILKSQQFRMSYRATGDTKIKAERLLRQYNDTPEWMRKYANDAKLAAYVCLVILGKV